MTPLRGSILHAETQKDLVDPDLVEKGGAALPLSLAFIKRAAEGRGRSGRLSCISSLLACSQDSAL
jgi:hypothetical protein